MPTSNVKTRMCLVSWAGSGPLGAGMPYTAMGDRPRGLCGALYIAPTWGS
jgi:hypothetical protein